MNIHHRPGDHLPLPSSFKKNISYAGKETVARHFVVFFMIGVAASFLREGKTYYKSENRQKTKSFYW
jgi:hypothetical protein